MPKLADHVLRARFFARVSPPDENGCHQWLAHRGGRTHEGMYGVLWDGERQVPAHRLAWSFQNGPIPAGLMILHSCDVPTCVNPEHLRPGTAADNSRDMVQRGRHGAQRRTQWVRQAGATRDRS